MNIVEKYGGTSVGTIEQIQAIALHAKHMKEQGQSSHCCECHGKNHK